MKTRMRQSRRGKIKGQLEDADFKIKGLLQKIEWSRMRENDDTRNDAYLKEFEQQRDLIADQADTIEQQDRQIKAYDYNSAELTKEVEGLES